MNQIWRQPALGVLVAIAITTVMDASGLSTFSALPLPLLMVLFWRLEGLSRAEIGFVLGRARHYGLALLHPVVVLGAIALTAWITADFSLEEANWHRTGLNLVMLVMIQPMLVVGLASLTAWIGGAITFKRTAWQKTSLQMAQVTLTTLLAATVIEEGFFRGWLWASLKRTGQNSQRILVWSTLAFTLWHLSAVLLETGFNPPPAQVPTLLVNAALLGAIWGLLRLMSGSVVVASVGHSVWNGLAYVFFGFGTRVGALGIQETAIFGPEVGVLGLVLNLAFAATLWQWCKRGRFLIEDLELRASAV